MSGAKALLLLRHAKSSWDDSALDDFDRPLARRAREAAPRIGREMERRGWLPDLAIVSPALRTRQTWELVSAELPRLPDITFDERIYEAAPSNIMHVIRSAPQRNDCLQIVGHNPGLEELAVFLAGSGSNESALRALREKFPTGALARLQASGNWEKLANGAALLTDFVRPRDLR